MFAAHKEAAVFFTFQMALMPKHFADLMAGFAGQKNTNNSQQAENQQLSFFKWDFYGSVKCPILYKGNAIQASV